MDSYKDLVEELFKIGELSSFSSPRAHEIGSVLHRLGGKEMVLRALNEIRESFGDDDIQELQMAWIMHLIR